MINVNIKSNKGITMITLIMAIIIMLVISSTLIYNANNGAKIQKLNNMYSDIQVLKDKVDLYYSSYGTLPVLQTQYTNIDNIKEINSNDNDKYYVIDLEMLENITLNYGKAYNDFKNNSSIDTLDVYIVNEQSHNIYYVKGVIVDNKTYYTIPGNYTKVIDNTAPTTPTIDIISGTKSKRGFYTGEVVLRVTPGIDKMSGVNKTTYKIIKDSQEFEETELESNSTITLSEYANYKIIAITYDNNNNKSASEELSFSIQEDYVQIYFKKGEYWADANNVYAYIWKNEDGIPEYKQWPGEKMNLVPGTEDIYSINVPTKYKMGGIIFNKGVAATQTVDITMPSEDKIYITDDAKNRNIYFRVSWPYASMHIWNDNGSYNNLPWPGTEIDSIKYGSNYYYYKCELPEGYENFILAKLTDKGSNKNEAGKQTADLVFERNNILYTLGSHGAISTTTVYSGGQWEDIEDWL